MKRTRLSWLVWLASSLPASSTLALVCAVTLATTAAIAAPGDENDVAAPSDDCGAASNCGGIGGWRLILLAKDGDDASVEDTEPVEDPEEPVDNRAPGPVGSIDDQELTVGGESATVDVAPFFSDPDGDELTYAASSSDEQVATASASGSSVTVAPVAAGTATITVTARDPGGLTAEQTFGARVTAASGDSYCSDGDTIQPGGECDIYGTTFSFDVDSNGRGCLRAGGFVSCAGSGLSLRNTTINGVRITFVASRNDNNSWAIEEVSPEPPD